MAVKKNKLMVAPFDDIQIIGINTTLIDYKMAYYLNQKLGFKFVRLDEILLDEVLPYAFFYYNSGENRNAYNLVSLKHKEHLCVKITPHVDFLLIVRNHITTEKLEQLTKSIREIKDVSHAFTLDLSRLPVIDILLERIEMHELHCLQEQQ